MGELYIAAKKIYKKLPLSLQYQISKVYKGSGPYYSKSYSQCGEDMVIKSILAPPSKNKKWLWIDIGANHPSRLSNTAFFYGQGRHGINIEADPKLIREFYDKRKKDINLNAAIADKPGEMDFYLMDSPGLNTLSAKDARENEKLGHKIIGIVPIKTMTVAEVLEKYCDGVFPDFLSLDAEGYDLTILKSICWEKTYPKIICVENIPYLPKLKNYFWSMQKSEISAYLETKNYSIIAFTLINAVFVHNTYIEKG